MEIPKHLQKDEFRFIWLDKDWSSSANYKHDASELKAHVWNGGKIGLLSNSGKMLIIQCTNDKLETLVKGKLPSTLLIRIGRNTHYLYAFFICDDIDETGLEQCDDQNQAVLPLWTSVPDVSGRIGYRMEKNEPVAHVDTKKVRDILTECFFPEKELPVSDFDMIPNGKTGWILQRKIEDEKKGKKKKRLFYFSKIKLYDYDYFDVYKNKFIKRNIVELYSADAKNPMKFRTRNADSVAATRLIKNFSSFKSWQVMQLYVPDIEAWLENELPHNFKHKSKKATSIYDGFLCACSVESYSGMSKALQSALRSSSVMSRFQSAWLSSQSRNGCLGLITATRRFMVYISSLVCIGPVMKHLKPFRVLRVSIYLQLTKPNSICFALFSDFCYYASSTTAFTVINANDLNLLTKCCCREGKNHASLQCIENAHELFSFIIAVHCCF